MIVLYRTTGVLNLSFGAVGAFGALIAWQLINHAGVNQWLAYLVCVLFGGRVDAWRTGWCSGGRWRRVIRW